MKCSFCEHDSSSQGIKSHERWCKENPDRMTSHNDYQKFTNDVVFVENSSFARHRLKERILKQNLIKYECECCEMGPEWRGKPMPLILDHRNGKHNDNRIDNLRFVCSNCDTQLPTYKSKNIGRVSWTAPAMDLKSIGS